MNSLSRSADRITARCIALATKKPGGSKLASIKVARTLWKHTRIDEGRIEPEPMAQDASADRPANTDATHDSPPPA
jgi:hypothetical protein